MRNHLFLATLAVSAAVAADARSQTMQLTPPRIGGFTSLASDGSTIHDVSIGGSSAMLTATGAATIKADNPQFLADPPGSTAGVSSSSVAGLRVDLHQGFGATSTSPIDAQTFDEEFSLRFSGGVPPLMAGAEESQDPDPDADGITGDFNVSMIPEPATLAMAGLGMLALPVSAVIIRRRRAGRSS